jgi:hypothetical protein
MDWKVIGGYLGFCALCHGVAKGTEKMLIRALDAEKYATEKLIKEWHNRFVSSVNAALFAVLFVLNWNVSKLQLKGDDPEVPMSDFEKNALNMMLGYLIYDGGLELSVAIAKSDFSSYRLQVLGHHALGLCTHTSILVASSGVAARLMTVIYGAEFSTPFLNTTWLLHNCKKGSSTLFLVLSALLILTFTFRIFIGPFVFYRMVTEYDSWSNYPKIYALHIFVSFSFSLLNFYWYYKVIEMGLSAMRSIAKPKSEKKS